MAEDDILIRLGFQMTNMKAVNAAIAKLKHINAIQTTSVQKTAMYTNGVKTAGYELTAMGQSSVRNFGNQERAINAATGSIAKYKGTAEATSSVTEQAGNRSIMAMNRQKRGLVGLRLAQHKAQRASWAFVMMSMSMLGVFFSMMSFTMLLGMGFKALVTPLVDLDMAIGKVADGFIFNEAIGNNLEGTYGSMADLIGGKVVPAWINIKALTGQFSLAMLTLGATIFSDQKLVDGISESINQFSIAMQDPEIQVAIKSMTLAFADLIPGIASSLPMFAAVLEAMVPFIPALSKLAFLAAVLMPVFSVMNAALMFLSKAIWIVAASTELLAVKGITLAVVSKAATGAVASLGAAIGIATLPVWVWAAAFIALVSAIGYLGYKLGWLDGIIQRVNDSWQTLMTSSSDLIRFGSMGAYAGMAMAPGGGGSAGIVNQYVSIGAIAEEVDSDRLIDRLVQQTSTARGI